MEAWLFSRSQVAVALGVVAGGFLAPGSYGALSSDDD
jgi:hypothetical protein